MKFTIAGKEVEVDDAVLSKALEEKTETLPITTDLVVRTPEEETAFKANTKTEHMKEGVEVAVKTVKRELGLEFTGKDIKDLATAAKEAGIAEAKIAPDKKVESLTKDLEIVKKQNLELEKRATDAEGNFTSFKSQIEIDKELDAAIPENALLDKNDMKTILKANLSIVIEEGKTVVKGPDGEILKHASTAAPKTVKESIEDFLKTNPKYLKPIEGGKGGPDSKGGGTGGDKKPLTEFIKEMQEKGISTSSEEFRTALEAEKDNIDEEA